MSNRLDTINSIILNNSELGLIYKQYHTDNYNNLLCQELNIDKKHSDLSEINSILYVYSTIDKNEWNTILNSDINSRFDLQKEICKHENLLKFKLTITTDMKKYKYFYPDTEYIYKVLYDNYSSELLNKFIFDYSDKNIKEYIEYSCKKIKIDNNKTIDKNISFGINADLYTIAKVFLREIQNGNIIIDELSSERLYYYLIKYHFIYANIQLSTSSDIFELEHLII